MAAAVACTAVALFLAWFALRPGPVWRGRVDPVVPHPLPVVRMDAVPPPGQP